MIHPKADDQEQPDRPITYVLEAVLNVVPEGPYKVQLSSLLQPIVHDASFKAPEQMGILWAIAAEHLQSVLGELAGQDWVELVRRIMHRTEDYQKHLPIGHKRSTN